MTDPPRLLSPESSANELERRMLTAWRDERPSPKARDATLAVLGLGPPGGSALAAGKLAKWTLLLLGIGAPIVVAVSHARAPAVSLARVETTSREETTAPSLDVGRPPQPLSLTSRPAVRTHPRAAAPADTLPAEIAALDRARAALAAGDSAKARTLVDHYDATFPNGVLREEACVVRIDALVAAGDMDEARRRTDQFASSHPSSPHLPRLRRLLLGTDARAIP